MNNLLLKSITRIENKNLIKNNFDQNKLRKKILNLIYIFNKIYSFSRFPNYFLPEINLNEIVNKYEKKIIIEVEDWELKEKYEIELKKILARIELRYGYSQQIILYELVKQITSNKYLKLDLNKFKWISPIYPIIHLPNDFSEVSDFHCDYREIGINGSKVIWLPYTNYHYPGITRKNKFLELIAHFLPFKKLILLNKSKDINIRNSHKKGFWMIWNDTFYHKGILNTSDKISIAFIIRLSNKFESETFLKIENINRNKGLFFNRSEQKHDFLVNQSKDISKYIIRNAKINENKEIFISKISKLLKKHLDDFSKFSADDKISILHMSNYAMKLFIQRLVVKKEVKWTNKNQKIFENIILPNLKEAKKLLENKMTNYV